LFLLPQLSLEQEEAVGISSWVVLSLELFSVENKSERKDTIGLQEVNLSSTRMNNEFLETFTPLLGQQIVSLRQVLAPGLEQ